MTQASDETTQAGGGIARAGGRQGGRLVVHGWRRCGVLWRVELNDGLRPFGVEWQ
jgi:hypothetical protein